MGVCAGRRAGKLEVNFGGKRGGGEVTDQRPHCHRKKMGGRLVINDRVGIIERIVKSRRNL